MVFSDEGVRCCSEKIPHGTVQANCKDICIYSCDQGYEAALPSRLVKCGFHGTWEPFSAFSEFMTDLCRGKFFLYFHCINTPT